MQYLLKYKNLFAVCVVIGVFMLVAKGIYTNYKLNLKRLERQQAELKEKNRWAEKIKKIDSEIEQLKEIPIKGDVLTFKNMLEKAADAHQVTIDSLRPSVIANEGSYEQVKVALNVTAKYSYLIEFIEEVEKGYAIEIREVNYGGDNTFNLSIVTWIRKQE